MKQYNSEDHNNIKSWAGEVFRLMCKAALSCILAMLFCSFSFAQAKATEIPPQSQKTFSSPKEAAEALINAAEKGDLPAMREIFGPAGEDLLSTEDPVQDKNIVTGFVAEVHQKNSIEIDPKNSNRAVLVVGNTDWPMPIPLSRKTVSGFLIPGPAARRCSTGASSE